MASSSVTGPFNESVSSSAEGDLAIDEKASTVSIALNRCVVTDLSVAVREREESVRDLLDHVSSEDSASSHHVLRSEADDNGSFVEIMSGITAVGDA